MKPRILPPPAPGMLQPGQEGDSDEDWDVDLEIVKPAPAGAGAAKPAGISQAPIQSQKSIQNSIKFLHD